VRVALLGDRIAGNGGEHRFFGAYRRTGLLPHAGLGGMAPSRMEPPGAACFLNDRRPRGFETPQATKRVRGLSRGFGFRRPAGRGAAGAWSLKARLPVASLASPARQFLYPRKAMNGPATSRAMSRRFSTPELVRPSLLARVSPTGIQWPGAARVGRRSPCPGQAVVRQWGPFWDVSELAGFPHPRPSLTAPQRGMPTPCVVALPLAPVRANGAAHHVALAPFAPQNSPFGYKEYP
jgi:hypothetical protein